MTASFGTATVFLVYQIGMRWGTRHALLAAALLALMPNHVRESHYVLTDVPMTFFVTLAFLQALQAHERGQVSRFFAAGLAAGLAAATKYNGAVALLLPLMAAYMTRSLDRPRMRSALIAVGGFLLAFLVAAPYTVLDLPHFLDGYGKLAGDVLARPADRRPWLADLPEAPQERSRVARPAARLRRPRPVSRARGHRARADTLRDGSRVPRRSSSRSSPRGPSSSPGTCCRSCRLCACSQRSQWSRA